MKINQFKGIIREIDPLGRITIPASYRKQWDLELQTKKHRGSEVEVLNTDQGILIRPVRA